MRVLVTNDDGIDAPGLSALAGAARDAGHEVVVAAPAEQSSGASASIAAELHEGRTRARPVRLAGLENVRAYAVSAQPGHIVRAALRGWLDPVPELVLSGINHGANVGRAVLHSGTVGAALTAGILGVRALAVSLDVALHPEGARYWGAATALFPRVVDLLTAAPEGTVASLNVPDRPAAEHRELRTATLAPFGAVQARIDRAGDDGWEVHEVEVPDEPVEGSDSSLLAAGHPTITALTSVVEDPDALDL